MTEKIKICSKCKVAKPADTDHFRPRVESADGLRGICKECFKEKEKNNRHINRDKILANQRRYHLKYKDRLSKKRKNVLAITKENGLCIRCAKEKAMGSYNSLCEMCWFKSMAKKHLGDCSRWMELKKLIISQNYKCAYSDEKLTIGLNTSIDHIFPITKKPELKRDIKNLQFVTIKINIMKNNFTHEEFIRLCGHIRRKYNV